MYHRDNDWIVGFTPPGADGTRAGPWPWHTHGEFLVDKYGGTPESAARDFVHEVLCSKRVIVVSRYGGVIRHVCVTNDPDADELMHAPPDKTVEKRFWNGSPYPMRGRI